MLYGLSGCEGLYLWAKSDCRAVSMCVHASCVNMTLLFRGYIYTCFFISTSFGCPWIPHSEIRHTHTHTHRPVQSDTHAHTHTCICKHERVRTHTHAHALNNTPSFFSDPYRAQCVCQPVAILPSTPVHQLPPRGPQSDPRGRQPVRPQSLFTQRKCQDQVWERQQFFVYSGQLVHSR